MITKNECLLPELLGVAKATRETRREGRPHRSDYRTDRGKRTETRELMVTRISA